MKDKNKDCEKINLEDHYVAFLDILGYKNFILGKTFDEELEFLINIRDAFYESIEIIEKEKNYQNELSELKFKTFSDNIVLALPKTMISTESFLYFTKLIRTLSNLMVTKFGLFLRGGVASGNYFQNGDISFGSALVNSYLLENEAKYPRVIFQKEIVEEFLKKDCENSRFSRLIEIILSNDSNKYNSKSLYEVTNNIICSLGFFHCETLSNDASQILSFLLSIMSHLSENTFELFINRFDDLGRILFDLEKKYCDLSKKSTILFIKDMLSVYSESENFYTLNPYTKNTSVLYILDSDEVTPSRFMKYADGSFGFPIMEGKDGKLTYQLTINEFMIHRTESIEELNRIKNIILTCINKYSNPMNEKVLSKYEWLKNYFNSHCSLILAKNFITQDEYVSLII